MYCCGAAPAAAPVVAVGPQRAAVHTHLIIFHLVYGCTPSCHCLHLPLCMDLSHYVHLNESLSREREGGRVEERGRDGQGTGKTRTGEERRLERNEYSRGALSKSVLT